MPTTLSGATQLYVLLLCGNQLKSFSDDLLLELCNIAKLDLRKNLIEELPSHWKGMTQILIKDHEED
uniref:Uncharacterized protein LOC100178027 n=1 Tax=Phallusia mammillata TaxID=59560 RepID=A0A6F9DHB1_9ASCI|nr:uncharacterized protein LOC100178027 [Phallusia mammillata]